MDDTPRRFMLSHDAEYNIPAKEPIWPEGVPDFEPEANNEDEIEERGSEYYNRFISNIRIPALYSFPAKPGNNNGKAVLICPGGAYRGVAFDKEGCEIARFFNSLGISAFVLAYRIPAPDGRNGHLTNGPLSDALRSIRIIRSRAAQYGIDPEKVGIMGFSSGGHLASTASTLYDTIEEKDEELRKYSARPSFTILMYAVISLYEGYCHSPSRQFLLGEFPSFEMLKKYSPEFQVNSNTPKVFLAMTEDDAVHPLNSLNYYKACLEHNVRAEMHVFPEGGHGYGMALRGLGIDSWPDRLAEWLEREI